ncbi:MAG: hypothetical protein GW939_01470 [Candidatus Magasanikbacteria bacterium]|uniref:Uncharacterized protein n=1 Tax=Candidatus Magasanikbacteria bacterium CG10_big_fil_rev_8_21_14_0_10_38_6 TaxID=1974647 RepID=A0A2M6P1C3_9BACT|nr:hypothetical protein [Candidatus Magasanikbacteria bacterium]NCS71976.1 hypothetical protein [Candidatus Magasanikbacteria bacterium]PIR77516.1 MAG: hypothetical protein COU30_02035 [Candidatus Magasanikbacteria bacterium CG10_big_fil_rev_8_21_14_0_10_38_6]
MHNPAVQHTLTIFERLCNSLPPLVPETVVQDIEGAYEQMLHNYSLSLDDLERTMIVFGKQIWPYRRAFDEFLSLAEGRMGEVFLRGIFSSSLKKRYNDFALHGGTYRDLYAGAPVSFFTSEERVELCEALVLVRTQLEAHTRQEVLTTEKKWYEQRILEFQAILDDIEKRLDTLRTMADSEQEHPSLAAEIRQHVLSFEYGICALGPHVKHEAVCEAEEYFVGRKKNKQLFQLHD